MPRHAEINCDIYDDLVNEGFSHRAIAVYLFYAITSQNLIGLYRTRPNRDRVSANLDRVSWEKGKEELQGKGKILWEDGWVWVVGKAKKIRGKKQIAAARKLLSEIPDTINLKKRFLAKYDTLSEKRDRVSAVGAPIPIPKERELSKDNSRSQKTDPRVRRLLIWFGLSFKDTFGVTYMATFKAEGKILRDQLRYADKSYPPGCAEVALALTMDEWLEKQKTLGEFKKTKIAGWLKDFNSINTEIDWQAVKWDELKKEYDDVQKKAKKDGT